MLSTDELKQPGWKAGEVVHWLENSQPISLQRLAFPLSTVYVHSIALLISDSLISSENK